MAGKANKTASAPEIDEHFSALIENLSSLKGYEAESMARELERLRAEAKSLITGRPETENTRHAYIKELAYIGGDPENGPKKSVKLSENDLIEIEDLGIRFSYATDVLFGRAIYGGDRVKLEFPNGTTGILYIKYFPENGTLDYTFRKDIRRVDEAA